MIVVKTALGVQVVKDRSVSLSAQQRSALILCDGKRSAAEILRMTVGVGVTMQDIEALSSKALIEIMQADAPEPSSGAARGAESSQLSPNAPATPVDFRRARDAAITLCADLGFRGFSINIAVVDADSMDKLQKLAPEMRRLAGDEKYRPLHEQIFGQPL